MLTITTCVFLLLMGLAGVLPVSKKTLEEMKEGDENSKTDYPLLAHYV